MKHINPPLDWKIRRRVLFWRYVYGNRGGHPRLQAKRSRRPERAGDFLLVQRIPRYTALPNRPLASHPWAEISGTAGEPGQQIFTGVEIHPGATIGRRLVIDHGTGIVIGETAVIGDDCLLYQGVTLGGTGKDIGKRHPTLGNNVMVGCGAKLLGPFTVGDNARIAANSVVLRDVPQDATVVGVPGRVVRLRGEKLDHIHTPDPVMLEIEQLKNRLATLEHALRKR